MRVIGILALLALSACATGNVAPGAPQPLKPIDPGQFFTGRWFEMARTPMGLTNGCVAGTTDFVANSQGQLIERDACRIGTPEGPEKIFAGPMSVLNPGQNNEFTVHYVFFGVIPFIATYWVLDHADDYSWFIVSTPSFHNVAILDRSANPPQSTLDAITAEVQHLGYDPAKLEFPQRFPLD